MSDAQKLQQKVVHLHLLLPTNATRWRILGKKRPRIQWRKSDLQALNAPISPDLEEPSSSRETSCSSQQQRTFSPRSCCQNEILRALEDESKLLCMQVFLGKYIISFISYHIISYHITSHHITSHHITSICNTTYLYLTSSVSPTSQTTWFFVAWYHKNISVPNLSSLWTSKKATVVAKKWSRVADYWHLQQIWLRVGQLQGRRTPAVR